MSDLDQMDKDWGGTETAKSGDSGFAPIPEGTEVKAVIMDQKPSLVGEKETPVVKVVFEVVEPTEFKGKKIFHDLWITLKNAPYLKRDLETLAWKGEKPSQLMAEDDNSLIMCGALVVTGPVEEYLDKNKNKRKKTTISYFKETFEYEAPEGAEQPAVVEESEEDIPF